MNGIGKANKSRMEKINWNRDGAWYQRANAGSYFVQVSIAHRHTNRPRWLEYAGMNVVNGKTSEEEMTAKRA